MGKWNGSGGHPEFDSHQIHGTGFTCIFFSTKHQPSMYSIGMLKVYPSRMGSLEFPRIQESNDTELADFEATLSAMDAVGRELDGIKTAVVCWFGQL